MFVYTLSEMNMKNKEIFWKPSLSECFFDSRSYLFNILSTSLPKPISRNLYLEKVYENQAQEKFKFSMPHVYLTYRDVIKEPWY